MPNVTVTPLPNGEVFLLRVSYGAAEAEGVIVGGISLSLEVTRFDLLRGL